MNIGISFNKQKPNATRAVAASPPLNDLYALYLDNEAFHENVARMLRYSEMLLQTASDVTDVWKTLSKHQFGTESLAAMNDLLRPDFHGYLSVEAVKGTMKDLGNKIREMVKHLDDMLTALKNRLVKFFKEMKARLMKYLSDRDIIPDAKGEWMGVDPTDLVTKTETFVNSFLASSDRSKEKVHEFHTSLTAANGALTLKKRAWRGSQAFKAQGDAHTAAIQKLTAIVTGIDNECKAIKVWSNTSQEEILRETSALVTLSSIVSQVSSVIEKSFVALMASKPKP